MQLQELADTADYLKEQLRELAKKEKVCCRCGFPLERIYYKIPDLCGDYCRECIHKIYNRYGITFYAKNSEEDCKSKCCEAPVKFKTGMPDFIGSREQGITAHYECTKCGKPCSVVEVDDEETYQD